MRLSIAKLLERVKKSIFEPSKKTASTEEYLRRHKVWKNSIVIVDEEKYISTETYLDRNGVGRNSLAVESPEAAQAKHILKARTIVLWSLVFPMSIIPLWLMLLLTLPGFGRTQMSERLQLAILGAVATDYIGLYYIVTRDLFSSKNNAPKSKPKKSENGDRDDE